MMKKLTEYSEAPKDVVAGLPIITMTGCTELNIENHSGIIEYTDILIRIRAKISQIIVCGKNLCIEYYTGQEIKIIGKIEIIEYKY